MKFLVHVVFDNVEDLNGFGTMEGLLGLVQDMNGEPQTKEEMRDRNVFRRLRDKNQAEEVHVKEALETARKIQEECLKLSMEHPSPEWVSRNQEAVDKGLVPLVLDPEKFMKDMRELRAQQAEILEEPIKTLERTLEKFALIRANFPVVSKE